jgi:hypothetical protein
MFHERRVSRLLTGLVSTTLLGMLLTSCSQTAAPEPTIIQRAQRETVAPPAEWIPRQRLLLDEAPP